MDYKARARDVNGTRGTPRATSAYPIVRMTLAPAACESNLARHITEFDLAFLPTAAALLCLDRASYVVKPGSDG
jgi:hypothetical protein